MKIPSIEQIWSKIISTFKRFPIAVLAALIGTSIAIYSVESSIDDEWLKKILFTATLSVFFFTALALASEVLNKISRNLIMAAGTLFMVWYFFMFPKEIGIAGDIFWMRQVFLCLASFVAITWAPFWKEKVTNEVVWEWVRQIIMNLVQTVFFGVVIFAGISAALFAINSLFGLNIDERIYFQIWTSVVGVFGPIFFLGNLDKNPRKLIIPKPIPTFMRILTKYILTPLAIGYFLILYTYTFKVLTTGEWPKNLLGWLVIGFSTGAIFTYFLWTPFWKDKIAKYRRLFWWGLLPQIAMLFIAISWRIQAYSWTENRYFVVILGLWLLGISIYFLINKKATFKSIFIALTAVILVSQIGPMSGYSVGERAQKGRLINLLEGSQMIENGKVIPAKIDLDKQVRYEISDTIDYLVSRHGKASVEKIFPEILAKLEKENKLHRYGLAQKITNELGLDFVSDWEMRKNIATAEDRQYFATKWNSVKNIAGYDWFISSFNRRNDGQSFLLGKRSIYITVNGNFIEIFEKDESLAKIDINPFLDELKSASNLQNNSDMNPEEMSYEYESSEIKTKILFNDISFEKENLNYFSGQIYLSFK